MASIRSGLRNVQISKTSLLQRCGLYLEYGHIDVGEMYAKPDARQAFLSGSFVERNVSFVLACDPVNCSRGM